MIPFKNFIRAILFFPLLVVSAPFWLPISLIQWLGTKVNRPQHGFKRLSLEEVDKALAAALEGTDFVPMDREGNIGIFGLHPHFHLQARGPLGGDRALQTGDSDFDKRVELSTQIPFEFDEEQGPLGVFRDGEVRRYRSGGGPIDDLELLSRLDHRCRQALGQRIAVLTVADGQLHGEPAAFREETFAYAPGPNDWLPICEALRYKPASSLEERLWSLVTEDPEQRVRCTVLQRWVGALRSDEVVPGDWDEAGLIERLVGEAVTESHAIELLEQPDRVEAFAAVYWLRTHGGADCMAGLARFVNAEEVSPQGKQRALGLLDRLQRQHGALAGGGVSLASAQEPGAVSVADEQGALSLAEREAREVQSRKDES